MGLHHATLKAAVLVYAALIGTMTEESLKAEIGKDEKGFSPEEVEEIFKAVLAKQAEDFMKNTHSTGGFDQPQPQLLESQTPEWVGELMKSNQSVIDSNKGVIKSNQELIDSNMKATDGVNSFREAAGSLASKIVSSVKAEVKAKPELKAEDVHINPESRYVVVKGQCFRDRNDFKREYEGGQNVSHLGVDVLKSLVARGLVKEA